MMPFSVEGFADLSGEEFIIVRVLVGEWFARNHPNNLTIRRTLLSDGYCCIEICATYPLGERQTLITHPNLYIALSLALESVSYALH